MIGVGAAVAMSEGGEPGIVVMMAAVALGTSALIFLISRGLMRLVASSHAARYAEFAGALGGAVVRNVLGECQLRIPHPRGRVELDYRTLQVGSDEVGDPFTRVALVCAAGSLPPRRIELTLGAGATELAPAARQAAAALEVAFGTGSRVVLTGRGAEPQAAVFVRGWVRDAEGARRCVELARPQLEALASAPWTA